MRLHLRRQLHDGHQPRPVRRTYALAGMAAAMALAGVYLIAQGSAATFSVASEAESGQRSGSLADGPAAGASAGGSVKFNGTTASGILFEDDFNGPAGSLPDQQKWGEYCPGTIMAGSWGLIRCGADETMDGSGHLVIPGTPQYGTALITREAYRFQYGTFSAWIKQPPEVGYWPAFWLINPVPGGGGGEIDILEGYTTWPTIYHDTVHAWAQDGSHIWASPDDFNETNVNLSAAYHKYSARVEPGKISFFFDDKPVGTVVTKTQHAAGKTWPFGPDSSSPHHMILNLALGGAGGAQQPATQPAKLLVDRVEVRAL